MLILWPYIWLNYLYILSRVYEFNVYTYVWLFMTTYGHMNYLISFFGSIDMLQMRVFLPAGIPLPCQVKGMGKNCTRLRVWVRVMGKFGRHG